MKRKSPRKSARHNSDQSIVSDVAVPIRETPHGVGLRQILTAIAKSAWDTSQQWAAVWKVGLAQLKEVVAGLAPLEMRNVDCSLTTDTHQAARFLRAKLYEMQRCTSILQELANQADALVCLQSDDDVAAFSTLTPSHFAAVLHSIATNYESETALKEKAVQPLPITSSIDVLNTSIMLWSHHVYLDTNYYSVKLLLRETNQL